MRVPQDTIPLYARIVRQVLSRLELTIRCSERTSECSRKGPRRIRCSKQQCRMLRNQAEEANQAQPVLSSTCTYLRSGFGFAIFRQWLLRRQNTGLKVQLTDANSEHAVNRVQLRTSRINSMRTNLCLRLGQRKSADLQLGLACALVQKTVVARQNAALHLVQRFLLTRMRARDHTISTLKHETSLWETRCSA